MWYSTRKVHFQGQVFDLLSSRRGGRRWQANQAPETNKRSITCAFRIWPSVSASCSCLLPLTIESRRVLGEHMRYLLHTIYDFEHATTKSINTVQHTTTPSFSALPTVVYSISTSLTHMNHNPIPFPSSLVRDPHAKPRPPTRKAARCPVTQTLKPRAPN